MFSSVAIFCPPPPIGKCPQCRATEVHYAVFSKKPIYWVMKMLYLSKVTLKNISCKLQWSMSPYSCHMAVLQKILGQSLTSYLLATKSLDQWKVALDCPIPRLLIVSLTMVQNEVVCVACGGHLDPLIDSQNRLWSLVTSTSTLLEIVATLLITWEMLKSMLFMGRCKTWNTE